MNHCYTFGPLCVTWFSLNYIDYIQAYIYIYIVRSLNLYIYSRLNHIYILIYIFIYIYAVKFDIPLMLSNILRNIDSSNCCRQFYCIYDNCLK